jgi:hypothetical protein
MIEIFFYHKSLKDTFSSANQGLFGGEQILRQITHNATTSAGFKRNLTLPNPSKKKQIMLHDVLCFSYSATAKRRNPHRYKNRARTLQMATRLASIFSPVRSPAHILHRALPRIRRRGALLSLPRMSSSSAATPASPAAAGGEKPLAAPYPYGSWRSPITADVVSGADRRLGGIALTGDGRLLWIEGRPEEKG